MSDFLAATITLVGHDGVLRGDEIFSNLKMKDVRWFHDGYRKFILHIGWPEQLGRLLSSGPVFIRASRIIQELVLTNSWRPGLIFITYGTNLRRISSPESTRCTRTNPCNSILPNQSRRSGTSTNSPT